MRTILILLVTLFSITTFGQRLTLEKASPFTAVKWDNETPIVQFKGEWYYFEKLDHIHKNEIVLYCKQQYDSKWKKRFSEDLVEVLKGMKHTPKVKVNLMLSKNDILKSYTGIFTLENRQKCLLYNRSKTISTSTKKVVKAITKKQAIEDIAQFQEILDTKSSYVHLTDYDYKTEIKELKTSILKSGETLVVIENLAIELSRILAKIGDRHSSVKNKSFHKEDYKNYYLKLPFGLTVINEKIAVVKKETNTETYSYYDNKFPYLKSIQGINIDELIHSYNYKDQKAPKVAKLTRGAKAIQNFGALLFKNNKEIPEEISVVLTNGNTDKEITVLLTKENKGFISSLEKENYQLIKNLKQHKNYEQLSKILPDNVGYIKIPMMFHPEDMEGLEQSIHNSFNQFENTKALIIDLRNNPGGGRELLQLFSNYIVQPQQSPWVANVAYLRTNKTITTDEKSMSGRYLYPYQSDKLTDGDRASIDEFNKTFKTNKTFDNSKFSEPFYMVLKTGKIAYTKPVYILVNENSFSAASVFTSAFIGLPNVTIVGVSTDGSSGNSRKIYLNNSGLRIKVSTMLSFQRNGKTLDGNGTLPDMYIPVNEHQIFTGKDTQLERLIEIIHTK